MNWAHWHMILVHFPIAGCIFALLILAWERYRKDPAVSKLAWCVVLLVAWSAFPAAITGGPSQEYLEPIGAELKLLIDKHVYISLFATWALQLPAACAILALIYIYRKRAVPAGLFWFAIATLLIATYMMAWCAALGGEIVHEEIRGDQIIPVPELTNLE